MEVVSPTNGLGGYNICRGIYGPHSHPFLGFLETMKAEMNAELVDTFFPDIPAAE